MMGLSTPAVSAASLCWCHYPAVWSVLEYLLGKIGITTQDTGEVCLNPDILSAHRQTAINIDRSITPAFFLLG